MPDILGLLIEERDRLDQAIGALSSAKPGGNHKQSERTHPPKWRREARRRPRILVSRSAHSRRIVKTLDRKGSVSRRKIQEVVARLG